MVRTAKVGITMKLRSFLQLCTLGLLVGAGLSLSSAAAQAAQGSEEAFEVSVDRAQMGMDESLSLRFSIRTEGTFQVGEPTYSAPDFDELNQFQSTFVESFYENGKFGVRNNKKLTKVLKPNRTGKLVISGIQVEINGRRRTHAPIQIEVVASGQGTPPPRKYGGSGMGLRGAGKQGSTIPFTIRVELDRSRVYKGQQLIVSYYLYRRAKVFNIQVKKYPVLDGFLREDLDLPILGQRLESESVVVDGVPYERSLLARYAAYPLKEGRMEIDSMSINGNYYPNSGIDLDSENPLQGFFQQLQPREWSHSSERAAVEVMPLPLDGRPASFTGGVGDFTLESTVNKREVKVNDAVALTLKVEGSGNTAAIGEPRISWPKDLEVFETKSRIIGGKGGVSTKVFEILVIPRKPGAMRIPGAELSYFSIRDKAYKTLSSTPEEITVLASDGAPAAPASPTAPSAKEVITRGDYLFPENWTPGGSGPGSSKRIGRLLILAMLAASGLLLAGVLVRRLVRRFNRMRALMGVQRREQEGRDLGSLKGFAARQLDAAAWSDVVRAYEELSQKVCLRIEEALGIPARAISREELLRRGLEEWGGDDSLWKRLVLLLEYCEWVRYGSSAGVVVEQEARSRFRDWVFEAERVTGELGRSTASKQ